MGLKMHFRNQAMAIGYVAVFRYTWVWRLRAAATATPWTPIRDIVRHVTVQASDDAIGLDRVNPIIASFMINDGTFHPIAHGPPLDQCNR